MDSVSSSASLVVTVVVLAFILFRQLRARPVTSRMLIPVVLIVVGLGNELSYSQRHPLSGAALAALAGLLVLDAGALGALRAWTVRLWREDGQVLRQGTWLTVALWLVGLGIHVAVDQVAGLGSSSLLLYLGITYLVQRLVLLPRAGRVR
ncbi:MAG: hypothetical protein J2P25_00725 [Nocardiopsaceae bacterium]|nr:hypothetical protein [Nocardiopsaceae bacterium]